MLNAKNLILLCLSGTLSALLTLALNQFIIPGDLISYFFSAFLSVIIFLLTQNMVTKSIAGKTEPSQSTTNETQGHNRESGTVKWFDSNKGYGFITRSIGGDIFVHFRSIKGNGYRSLYEGQSVEFVVTEGDKGPQAEDILIVK